MSESLTLIEHWYASIDFEKCLHEDVDFEVMDGFFEGGKYRGRQQVAEMFPRFMGNFSEFKAEVVDLIDGGRAVTGIGVYNGRLKSNNNSFSVPFCHIWYVDDGKIVRMRHFVNTLMMQEVVIQAAT